MQPERAAPALPERMEPNRVEPGRVEPERAEPDRAAVAPQSSEQLTPSAGGDVTLGEAGLPTGDSLQPVGRQYARTGTIEHQWRKNGGHRTSVAFTLSFSAEPGQLEAARVAVEDNWSEAVERAQGICELVDLTSETGRFQCEAVLRQRLSDVFFTTTDGKQLGRVERVIWDRLTWR